MTSLSAGESGGQFAHIDIVSNHTVFANSEHYWALMRGNALPVDVYSTFMHEATHHWCFTSPLATALSLLQLSVAKRVLRWACTDTDSEARFEETLDDFFVFQAAVKWLRPLNEGLAQFAEYDVLPRESAVLRSPPTEATLLHLFNMPERLSATAKLDSWAAYYKLADDIIRWRLSPKSIDRKVELLLQPLDLEQGGYLLGYLTVKQIWRRAQLFYDELKDADVFMMFLRKLVYADFELVAALLDRKKSANQRALSFGWGLRDRLRLVRSMLLVDEDETPWSQLEKIVAPLPGEESEPPFFAADKSFFVVHSRKLAEQGKKLETRYFKEVAAPIDLPLGETGFRFPPKYFWNVVEQRHLLWLGEVSAKWVSIGPKKGRVMVGAEVLYDNYELINASDEGLDELRLDIYIDLYGRYQVTTISGEHGVFGFAYRHASKKLAAKLLERKLDRREIIALVPAMHTGVDSYIQTSNFHDVFAAFWKSSGRELLDDIYRGFGFNFNKAAEKLMSERGIAEILENDPELVRCVAAITLAASAGLSPEGLLSVSDRTVDPLETIRRVNELWRVDDFPLARVDRDGFLDSAF